MIGIGICFSHHVKFNSVISCAFLDHLFGTCFVTPSLRGNISISWHLQLAVLVGHLEDDGTSIGCWGSNGAGCMKWSGWPTLHGLVVYKTSEAALAKKVAEAPIDLLGKAGVSR